MKPTSIFLRQTLNYWHYNFQKISFSFSAKTVNRQDSCPKGPPSESHWPLHLRSQVTKLLYAVKLSSESRTYFARPDPFLSNQDSNPDPWLLVKLFILLSWNVFDISTLLLTHQWLAWVGFRLKISLKVKLKLELKTYIWIVFVEPVSSSEAPKFKTISGTGQMEVIDIPDSR